MATNSSISVTELDFDNIKSSLKTYISAKPEFTDYNFEGSTMSLLLDLLSYNTYQNAFYTSMVGNEMFLDSAQLRNNVISRAKMLNYTPRSARGANTTATIVVSPTDTTLNFVTIPKDTEWSTTINGEEYKFVTPESYNFYAEDSYTGTITITEGRSISHRWTVDTSNPVKYILPNEDIDTRSITVDIQESDADTTTTRYTLATDITTVSATSTVYFLQEIENNQYEIYFGDNILGKKPINNNIIIINYRICNGSLGNDIATTSFNTVTSIGGHAVNVTINAATSGGANNETIDSIKYNAPKNYETQNRAVLKEDYRRIILRDNGDLNSVNVWGGEENTPKIYGKVYISVKPKTSNVISSERKDSIKNQLKKYNIMGIDPEFVDASFLYIKPTITANFNSVLTSLNAGAVQTKILNAITSFETANLGTFTANKFKFSQFIKAIDDSDASITSNLTSVKMERRFIPSLTTSSTYNIAFNNSIYNPHSGHMYAISSSAFTYLGRTAYFDDNGNGILRIYYMSGINRIYLNSTAGTIDYNSGLITISSFLPTNITGSELSIFVDPASNNINAVRNQILLIAGATVTLVDDTTSLIAANTVTATTAGVTTTVSGTGINTVIY